jgi:hypothetical protein
MMMEEVGWGGTLAQKPNETLRNSLKNNLIRTGAIGAPRNPKLGINY